MRRTVSSLHSFQYKLMNLLNLNFLLLRQRLKNKMCVKKHMKYKHVQKPEQTECPMCGKIFANYKNFLEHRRIVHTENIKERHKCLVCGKGFAQPCKLKVSNSKGLRLVFGVVGFEPFTSF